MCLLTCFEHDLVQLKLSYTEYFTTSIDLEMANWPSGSWNVETLSQQCSTQTKKTTLTKFWGKGSLCNCLHDCIVEQLELIYSCKSVYCAVSAHSTWNSPQILNLSCFDIIPKTNPLGTPAGTLNKLYFMNLLAIESAKLSPWNLFPRLYYFLGSLSSNRVFRICPPLMKSTTFEIRFEMSHLIL